MRWKRKPDERIKKRFLIWPRCIDGEYRWLEWVRWLQSRRNALGWYDVSWIENEEKEKEKSGSSFKVGVPD